MNLQPFKYNKIIRLLLFALLTFIPTIGLHFLINPRSAYASGNSTNSKDQRRICELNLLCTSHPRNNFCPISKGCTYYFKFSTKVQDGFMQIFARVLAIDLKTGRILIEGIHPLSFVPSRWILSSDDFAVLVFVACYH